ncbi:thiamine pyrophosphate-dependent enzyme [Paraburkholderia eburnea]|uniref:thiamine pyrophosphate-dependent enzyme n=1 Tax=Paraburkholderia eburnea TaxID=1189126 RepID=UPI001FC938E3|nr:thiamine pyrophosphate-dependent enzyme [Paraburkholderia eburnea]
MSDPMGYGLPAAVAAKIADRDRTVVALAGDGDFLMNGQELAAALAQRLGIVVIVFERHVRHHPDVSGTLLSRSCLGYVAGKPRFRSAGTCVWRRWNLSSDQSSVCRSACTGRPPRQRRVTPDADPFADKPGIALSCHDRDDASQ